MIIGYLVGMVLGSGIKKILGYYAAYTIAIGCTLGAMLYALLFLKDSRTMRPDEALKEAELENPNVNSEIPDPDEKEG